MLLGLAFLTFLTMVYYVIIGGMYYYFKDNVEYQKLFEISILQEISDDPDTSTYYYFISALLAFCNLC